LLSWPAGFNFLRVHQLLAWLMGKGVNLPPLPVLESSDRAPELLPGLQESIKQTQHFNHHYANMSTLARAPASRRNVESRIAGKHPEISGCRAGAFRQITSGKASLDLEQYEPRRY
jgi:hypothetical protein